MFRSGRCWVPRPASFLTGSIHVAGLATVRFFRVTPVHYRAYSHTCLTRFLVDTYGYLAYLVCEYDNSGPHEDAGNAFGTRRK
jgi:hypothetical protein